MPGVTAMFLPTSNTPWANCCGCPSLVARSCRKFRVPRTTDWPPVSTARRMAPGLVRNVLVGAAASTMAWVRKPTLVLTSSSNGACSTRFLMRLLEEHELLPEQPEAGVVRPGRDRRIACPWARRPGPRPCCRRRGRRRRRRPASFRSRSGCRSAPPGSAPRRWRRQSGRRPGMADNASSRPIAVSANRLSALVSASAIRLRTRVSTSSQDEASIGRSCSSFGPYFFPGEVDGLGGRGIGRLVLGGGQRRSPQSAMALETSDEGAPFRRPFTRRRSMVTSRKAR